MANAQTKGSKAGRAVMALALLVVIAIAIVIWWNRPVINGYANAGTAYAARVACSCRFVAGRSLADCEKDKIAGMELVSLADDTEAQSVTASFPLIASSTATHRAGYGCVLEEWRR